MQGLGLWVLGLADGVEGLGFSVVGLGLSFRVQDLWFRFIF